ncbi:uncharacterized protein B0I36DRAFT_345741 [Microdochium trichocladiopsis]|uniref:Uncharacterized protein n=1 Tax=Microdochium trichocladiopsis TaxID=1682393 RepID=A0A9P9BY36_9PEZI|nr:uncharacterized protein B0I36DRAFT_345741 [Microdochium trichocladiopsis]KAH7037663.1 hypothetical protein B0I36DRAFT_345741 [Microdochium trichocladiopsis]
MRAGRVMGCLNICLWPARTTSSSPLWHPREAQGAVRIHASCAWHAVTRKSSPSAAQLVLDAVQPFTPGTGNAAFDQQNIGSRFPCQSPEAVHICMRGRVLLATGP